MMAVLEANLVGLPEKRAAEPAMLTGAMVGYVRVFTAGELLGRQSTP